jgi:hypothetical protein
MVRKPRREEVKKLLKNLLDSEIPEIHDVAKQLSERVKQLEAHSVKLQNFITQIEGLAIEEADALDDTRIHELVTGLEKVLGERRRKPGTVVEPKTEAKPKAEVGAEAEAEPEEQVELKMKAASVRARTYSTPDGLVIRKTRI